MKKVLGAGCLVLGAWCLVLGAAATAFAAPADNGGWLIKKGTYLGKVALVDTQDVLAFSNVQAVADLLAKETKLNIVAMRHAAGKPADLKKELGVQVLVSVINDPAEPMMLIAPEDHWGSMNVAKLTDDLPTERAKKRFFDSRARKELIRTFSLMCGGGSSQFRGNIMNAATMKELDHTVDAIPVDMIDHYQTYLKAHGVTQKEMVTYQTACEEGWAPKPTNDVQKAIWKEVCTVPDQPMKIEYKKTK